MVNATDTPLWTKRFAYPILVLGLVTGAFSPIFLKLSGVGPVATGASRMIGALPFYLLPLLRAQNRADLAAATARDRWLIVASGVFLAGDLSFWYWGVTLSSVADATFLANTTPIFVALVSWLMFGERLERSFLLGAVISIAGAGVMMVNSLRASAHGVTGDALALIAACLYTGYVLSVSRVRRRVSTAVTMAVSCASTAVVLTAVAILTEPQFWPSTTQGWLAIAGLVFVAQLMGQTAIALSLAHVPANLAALTFLMQPLVPAAVAWVMFDERMSLIQGLGAALILAGVEFARRSASGAKTPTEP